MILTTLLPIRLLRHNWHSNSSRPYLFLRLQLLIGTTHRSSISTSAPDTMTFHPPPPQPLPIRCIRTHARASHMTLTIEFLLITAKPAAKVKLVRHFLPSLPFGMKLFLWLFPPRFHRSMESRLHHIVSCLHPASSVVLRIHRPSIEWSSPLQFILLLQ